MNLIHHPLRRRVAHAGLATMLIVSVLALAGLSGPAAGANVSPVAEPGGGHVTADALPTVQMNGVVWDQEIIGNTVYAAGEFTSARPAGAPVGTDETPRFNILAFDLTTGALISNFAPNVNRQIKVITKSPDGSRLYIGGEFTSVDGVSTFRLAALDANTGALIPSFAPTLDYRVNDIVATSDTVYAAGAFNYGGPDRLTRSKLAAFSASNGDLLGWAPSADGEVYGITLGPDSTHIFAGGRFQNVNGTPAYGLAKIDATTGALVPWATNGVVRDAGAKSAILSISTDGTSIFGTGYHFGGGGNLEGSFSADPDTGAINWVEDCHGDHYDHTVMNGYVYTVSHSHYCSNIGGYPQSSPWTTNQRHAMSTTANATGLNRREAWGYANWEGTPSPSLTNWFPEFAPGEYTGKTQAGWTVESNSQYLVMGGEFLRVNNTPQQGLVRFAVKPLAPADQGPRLGSTNFPVNVQSTAPGQARITFPANWDRDDSELNYRIVRNSDNANPVYQTRAASTFWDQPMLGFTDTGLTPGQTYSYRVFATDDDGNAAASDPTTVTIATTGTPSAYANAVMADGARLHWRFRDPAGSTTAAAAVGPETGSATNVSFGATGAILNEGDTAAQFSSSSTSRVVDPNVMIPSDNLSVEAWVRTSSFLGGRIIGMGNATTGASSTFDRLLYMTNNGRVIFGARQNNPGAGPNLTNTRQTIESQSGLNNNQWHHIVGTLGPQGMHLFVDGVRVASRGDVTRGQAYEVGYWRVGADALNGWASRPSTDYLSGQIDEPAVYEAQLSAAQVANHYIASGRTPALPAAPADAYGAAVRSGDPYLQYRLADSSGSATADSGLRSNTGDYVGSVTKGQSGVIAGNNSVNFGNGGFAASRTALYAPANYSVEAWVNTTSDTGGAIVGFGNSRTGVSSTSDRQVYMRNDGRIAFRVAGGTAIESIQSFNDGVWHHVVAAQGPAGMSLHVDGTLVGTNAHLLAGAYSGYWKVGTETTGGGSSSDALAGRIDEVAVYERVLPLSEIINHLTLGGGQVANVAPSASFNVSAVELDATLDGTASSDPDGSIVAYDWDFGDGATTTGTSPTTTHHYASGGTYTVTLTVTDDDDATHTTTRSVTATDPPPNVAPTASFEIEEDGLTIELDAVDSADSDGSIVAYDWDFGDGTTGTGATTSHTYAADGIYTVTLTVTDDDGAPGVQTDSVTVAAPTGPQLSHSDAFERTVANGWGPADEGGAWTTTGTASRFAVAAGVGIQRLNAGTTLTAFLTEAAPEPDSVVTVDTSWDKVPTGGGIYTSLAVRRIGNSDYRVRVRAMPTSSTIALSRVIDGVETTLSSANVPGLAYQVGDVWRFEIEALGTGPTTLAAKVWKTTEAEPASPQVTASDSTASLQAGGGTGVVSYLSSSSTNAPVVASFDSLLATAPGWTPPIPNVAPSASFTGVPTGLHLAVDASGSTDSDGTVEAYDWTFGDGTAATGATASHTYAAAGTYDVTLTVTDDDDATGAVTHQFTVEAPPVPDLASDTFERSATNGFGTADLGGAWTVAGGATNFSVSAGQGRILLPAASVSRAATLTTVSVADVLANVDLALDTAPTGGGTYLGLAVRKVGNNEYRARVRVQPSATTIQILKVVANVETQLASVSLPGVVYTPGSVLHLQLKASGSGTTTLAAKAWFDSVAEPGAPQVQTTDTTPELQAAGGVGVHAYVTGSTTNAPLVMSVDNLKVKPA